MKAALGADAPASASCGSPKPMCAFAAAAPAISAAALARMPCSPSKGRGREREDRARAAAGRRGRVGDPGGAEHADPRVRARLREHLAEAVRLGVRRRRAGRSARAEMDHLAVDDLDVVVLAAVAGARVALGADELVAFRARERARCRVAAVSTLDRPEAGVAAEGGVPDGDQRVAERHSARQARRRSAVAAAPACEGVAAPAAYRTGTEEVDVEAILAEEVPQRPPRRGARLETDEHLGALRPSGRVRERGGDRAGAAVEVEIAVAAVAADRVRERLHGAELVAPGRARIGAAAVADSAAEGAIGPDAARRLRRQRERLDRGVAREEARRVAGRAAAVAVEVGEDAATARALLEPQHRGGRAVHGVVEMDRRAALEAGAADRLADRARPAAGRGRREDLAERRLAADAAVAALRQRERVRRREFVFARRGDAGVRVAADAQKVRAGRLRAAGDAAAARVGGVERRDRGAGLSIGAEDVVERARARKRLLDQDQRARSRPAHGVRQHRVEPVGAAAGRAAAAARAGRLDRRDGHDAAAGGDAFGTRLRRAADTRDARRAARGAAGAAGCIRRYGDVPRAVAAAEGGGRRVAATASAGSAFATAGVVEDDHVAVAVEDSSGRAVAVAAVAARQRADCLAARAAPGAGIRERGTGLPSDLHAVDAGAVDHRGGHRVAAGPAASAAAADREHLPVARVRADLGVRPIHRRICLAARERRADRRLRACISSARDHAELEAVRVLLGVGETAGGVAAGAGRPLREAVAVPAVASVRALGQLEAALALAVHRVDQCDAGAVASAGVPVRRASRSARGGAGDVHGALRARGTAEDLAERRAAAVAAAATAATGRRRLDQREPVRTGLGHRGGGGRAAVAAAGREAVAEAAFAAGGDGFRIRAADVAGRVGGGAGAASVATDPRHRTRDTGDPRVAAVAAEPARRARRRIDAHRHGPAEDRRGVGHGRAADAAGAAVTSRRREGSVRSGAARPTAAARGGGRVGVVAAGQDRACGAARATRAAVGATRPAARSAVRAEGSVHRDRDGAGGHRTHEEHSGKRPRSPPQQIGRTRRRGPAPNIPS